MRTQWGVRSNLDTSASNRHRSSEKGVLPRSLVAGSRWTWKRIRERKEPGIVQQRTPDGCGGAVGEMLAAHVGLQFDQDLIVETGRIRDDTNLLGVSELAFALNKLAQGKVLFKAKCFFGKHKADPTVHSELRGVYAAIITTGRMVGHWVLVLGAPNDLGEYTIWDPADASAYEVSGSDFRKFFSGQLVFPTRSLR